jgi:hypothetical protein
MIDRVWAPLRVHNRKAFEMYKRLLNVGKCKFKDGECETVDITSALWHTIDCSIISVVFRFVTRHIDCGPINLLCHGYIL